MKISKNILLLAVTILVTALTAPAAAVVKELQPDPLELKITNDIRNHTLPLCFADDYSGDVAISQYSSAVAIYATNSCLKFYSDCNTFSYDTSLIMGNSNLPLYPDGHTKTTPWLNKK